MNELLNLSILENEYQSFIDYIDVDDLTIKTYKTGIERFLEYLRTNSIEQPKRRDVVSFRDYLRSNYSSATTNSYMTSVKALFKYLEMNRLYENIARDIKGARYSTTPKKQVLTQDQVKTIYNNLVDKREKALFSLLITTGLRGIEVARAKLEDITLYNDEIVLWVQCKKHDTKDEYVKLSKQVLKDITDYIGNRRSGYIFVSTSNNNKDNGLSTCSIRKIIKDIFKRFGLDSDTFSLHSTRRTSATLMYQNGADVHSIQQVLHHVSIGTTTRYINAITRNENKNEYIVSNILTN